MSTQTSPRMTFEQYLAVEREAEFKSEFLNGAVRAMEKPTRSHDACVANSARIFDLQSASTSCQVRDGKIRLFMGRRGVATYPDLGVTRGPAQWLDDERDTLTDATFVLEVLSLATRDYDRGDKFYWYRSLPSFAEFLALSLDRIGAEHHRRLDDGAWLFREYTEPDTRIELESIGFALMLGDLYDGVELEKPDPNRPRITFDEYPAMGREAEFRSEFIDGEVRPLFPD